MSFKYLQKSSWATLCYTTSGALSKIITFFVLPYFLSKVSLEEFGIWDWYYGWSVSLVSLGAGFSIIALPRFIALYTHDKQKNAISNCFIVGILISSLIACSALPFCIHSTYLVLSLSIVCLSIPFNILLSYFSSLQYVFYYSSISFTHHILTLLMSIVLVWYGYGTLSFFVAHCISLLIFLPFFLIILYNHRSFDRSIAYQQLTYSLPIIIHCFVYTLFCLIDRLALSSSSDLGKYALLMRFAAMFHTIALSITNAWPALCFEAHHRDQKEVSKLIDYFSLFLWMGYFGTCLATAASIELFFRNYIFLIPLMPIFLTNPLLLSFAQLYTVGASISNTTLYLPFLTTGTALLQYILLWCLKSNNLFSINITNLIPFGFYLISNIIISLYFTQQSINIKRITILHTISSIFGILVAIALMHYIYPGYTILLMSIWFFTIIALLFRSEIFLIKKEIVTWLSNRVTYFFRPSIQKRAIKNILFLRTDISDDISAQCGGAAAQTLGVIKGWQDNGIRVHVASYSMHQLLKTHSSIYFKHLRVWPWKRIQRSSIELSVDNKSSHSPKRFGFIKWRVSCIVANITFLWQLRSIFKEHHIDAIYQSYTVLNMTGLLARYIWKVPLIIEYNGSEVWTYQVGSSQRWLRFDRIASFIENITQRSADCLVVVSELLKDTLCKNIQESNHILVKPNGVCTQSYDPGLLAKNRHYIRTSLDIDNKIVIGYTGTFSHWHGIELFNTFIIEACRRFENIHFILIGDGPLYEPLKKIITDSQSYTSRVTFTGYVSHDDNKSYLSACDLYICPALPVISGTRNFCSPIKLFEYMSMAKPIIAASVEQIASCMLYHPTQKLQHSDSGILVNAPYHTDDFLHALKIMIEASDEQRTLWGANGRLKATHYFTWKTRIKDIADFIHNKD